MTISSPKKTLPISIKTCLNQSQNLDVFSDYILQCMNAEFCDNPQQHLKTIVVFAIVFSGIACVKQLEAFYNSLCKQELTLVENLGELCCELKYNRKGHPANLLVHEDEDSEEQYSYSVRCIDSLTSLVLLGFIKRRNLNKKALPTFDQLLEQIDQELYKKTRTSFSKQNLIQQLFVSGQMMTHARTPEFLFQFATGATFAGASESDSWHYKPKTQNLTSKCASKNSRQFTSINLSERLVHACESNTVVSSDNGFINTILNICDSEGKHFNRTKVVDRVHAHIYSKKLRSVPAEILAQWILSGLSDKYKNGNYRWGQGKGTPVAYLKMIKDDWREMFEDIDITEMADGESEEIYQLLLAQKAKENSNYGKTLPLLYKFIALRYPGSIDSPEFILEEDGVNFVRSRLITEDMFQKCINKLLEHHCGKDNHFKRALEVLVTLIFRLGLRPKEAFNLKLKNVSFGEVCEIEIHRNKESGKSASADRRIKASLFLKPQELENLKQVYDARIFQSENKLNGLLFSQCISTNKKFDYVTVNTPAAKFLSEIAGYRTVFYQCRHTFITNLMLICFAKTEVATEVTCYDATQVEQIKKEFCVNRSTILDQISGFAGHLSPKTTLISYAHRVHFCLINFLENGYHGIALKALSKLLNIRQSDLKRKVNIDGLSTKDDEQKLIKCVRAELKKYVKITKVTSQNNQSLNLVNTEHWKPLAPTVALAIEVGRYLSLSLDEKKVAEGLSVDLTFCEGVRKSILKLKDDGFVATHQQAEKGHIATNPNKITIPSIKPVTYIEILEIANKLLPLKTNLEDYDAIAKKFLLSPITKPYVLFSNVDELVKVLKTLKTAVPLERWKVKCESVFNKAPDRNIAKVKRLLSENNVIPSKHTVQDAVKYPEGRYSLYHRHVNEQLYIQAKPEWEVYSDNVVRTAVYWAEIFSHTTKVNTYDSKKSSQIKEKQRIPEQLNFLDDLE